MENKLEHLKEYLKGLGSVAVAFSSGVDSTFLLKVAQESTGRFSHISPASLRNWRLKDFQRILRTDVIYVKKNCLRRLAILQKRMGLNILQRDQIWMITAITDQV